MDSTRVKYLSTDATAKKIKIGTVAVFKNEIFIGKKFHGQDGTSALGVIASRSILESSEQSVDRSDLENSKMH